MAFSARRLPYILCSPAIWALASASLAGTADPSALVIVRASTESGLAGEFRVQLSSVNFNADLNRVIWSRNQPTPITDTASGALIATVQSVSVSVTGTTLINMSATVRAAAASVTCEVESILLDFPEQAPGTLTGRASASLSVSDLDGNGAEVRGVGGAGAAVYMARLEGAGVNFAELVGSVSVGASGTAAASQSDPPVGFRPIAVGPDGMSARLLYTLTANDLAASTTGFELRNVVGFQLFADGDMNCDRGITPSDISGFVLALTNETNYDTTFPNCNQRYADLNADGKVSVSDIGAFVATLLGEPAPSPR